LDARFRIKFGLILAAVTLAGASARAKLSEVLAFCLVRSPPHLGAEMSVIFEYSSDGVNYSLLAYQGAPDLGRNAFSTSVDTTLFPTKLVTSKSAIKP